MSNFEGKAARAVQAHQLVRNAVAQGHGEEAKRLADKHRIPSALRFDLGVELSDDPELKKVPQVK